MKKKQYRKLLVLALYDNKDHIGNIKALQARVDELRTQCNELFNKLKEKEGIIKDRTKDVEHLQREVDRLNSIINKHSEL